LNDKKLTIFLKGHLCSNVWRTGIVKHNCWSHPNVFKRDENLILLKDFYIVEIYYPYCYHILVNF